MTVTVNEGIRVEPVPTCALCHGLGRPLYEGLRDHSSVAPGVWSFLRCPSCGLVWLNPRPVAEDIGKLYADYFTHTLPDTVEEAPMRRLPNLRRAIKQAILADYGYGHFPQGGGAEWLGRFVARLFPLKDMVGIAIMHLDGRWKGRLLDVGCGNGSFLATMRGLGWEVVGVEPDAEAAKLAQERFEIPVSLGTLEDARLPDRSFDAVTLCQVIEHLPDPFALLRECRRVLRPGGRVVVITPSFKSLGHHIFSESWRGLEAPRHLHLFSLSTLRTCAERAGLRVAKLRTTTCLARWRWAFSRLMRCNGKAAPEHVTTQLRVEGWLFQVLEEILRVFWKAAGEEILLIATRDEVS